MQTVLVHVWRVSGSGEISLCTWSLTGLEKETGLRSSARKDKGPWFDYNPHWSSPATLASRSFQSCLRNGQSEAFPGKNYKAGAEKINQSLSSKDVECRAYGVSAPCSLAGFQRGGSRFAKGRRTRKLSCGRAMETVQRCLSRPQLRRHRGSPRHLPFPCSLRNAPAPRSLSIISLKKKFSLSWVCVPYNVGWNLFYFHLFLSNYLDVNYKLI